MLQTESLPNSIPPVHIVPFSHVSWYDQITKRVWTFYVEIGEGQASLVAEAGLIRVFLPQDCVDPSQIHMRPFRALALIAGASQDALKHRKWGGSSQVCSVA